MSAETKKWQTVSPLVRLVNERQMLWSGEGIEALLKEPEVIDRVDAIGREFAVRITELPPSGVLVDVYEGLDSALGFQLVAPKKQHAGVLADLIKSRTAQILAHSGV
jgi:hypothetical protein